MEAGVDGTPTAEGIVSTIRQCEPIVKIEPPEDIKDITEHDFFASLPSNLWTYLLKCVRYKFQKEHGRKMDCLKMTKLLLVEVETLMEEVCSFVESSCNSQIAEDDTNVIDISPRLSSILKSSTRLQVNEINVIPGSYKESIFAPLQKKEIDIMDVEQSMMHSVFQDDDDDDDELDNLPVNFADLPDDFKLETNETTTTPSANLSESVDNIFPPMSTSGFPEPTLVPGKEGGKIKTFYKCEKCNKSFPKRKRYYNHKFNGKCTIEPKWIRWHKNHKRVECAHPDCGDKGHINYTYPGLMKHIIEMHTVQEDSTIQCPDCPLKFPLKAALKYHQEMAHQAHAKICTVCGKVVRDMRKHRLIHTGEKPFQCDRCSYRCARSSSLKRHLATHLNAAVPQQHMHQQQPQSQTIEQTLDDTKFHLTLQPSLPPVSVALPQALHHPQDHQQQHQMHPQDHQQHEQLSQVAYDPNNLHYRAMKFA